MNRWTMLGALLCLAGPGIGSASQGSGSVSPNLTGESAPVLIAQGAKGRSVKGSKSTSGSRVTKSSSSTVTRSGSGSVSRSRSSSVQVKVPYKKAPPPPSSSKNSSAMSGAQAGRPSGVRIHVQVAPSNPPPPPRSSSYSPSPPPPAGSQVVRPPPPSVGSPYRPPRPPTYHSSTVYVYPRVYSTMWGWWWWAPPGYNQSPPSRRPAPETHQKAERREKPKALHVGQSSFGVWGGVSQGYYKDGTLFSDPGIRFSYRHRSTKHLGIDLSGGYYGTTMYSEEDRSQRRVDAPIQLSATYHLFPTLPVQVYGLAGMTVDFRDFQKVDYTNTPENMYPESGESFYYTDGRQRTTSFGAHVGLGLELMVNEDISIHGDLRWISYNRTDFESNKQTYPIGYTANAGMSFYF